MNDIDMFTVVVVLGLAFVTVLARGFFRFSSRPWSLPYWVQRGLQYAPIAALAGVVLPDVVMVQGQLVSTWQDARLYGAATGAMAFFWRRDVLFTILAGMAVYLPLHIGLGW